MSWNEWKQYLLDKGWIPNSGFTLWLDGSGRLTFVYTTAEAWKIQFYRDGGWHGNR